MTVLVISEQLRVKDKFHHIEMGFLNSRLCLGFLPPELRQLYSEKKNPGTDHSARFENQHLLVTLVLDCCEHLKAPTLLKAMKLDKPCHLFRSTERLAPCPEIYDSTRVCHEVELDLEFGKPVVIAYHTNHVVSDTGKMTLSKGMVDGFVHSIVGQLHNKPNRFEIEPMVIGAPWFDHPRNGEDSVQLMWYGNGFGEILPEDIQQISKMRDVKVKNKDEWMNVMKDLPEEKVKKALASFHTRRESLQLASEGGP